MSDSNRSNLRSNIFDDSMAGIKSGNVTKIEMSLKIAQENYLLELVEYIKGYKLFHEKNYTTSLTHIENSLKIDPRYVPAHVTKAAVLIAMGNYKGAIESCDYSIQNLMIMNYAQFFLNKGVALRKMERLDEAMSCYLQAIEEDSKYELAYMNAMLLAIMKNDFNILLTIAQQSREKLLEKPNFLNEVCSRLLIQLEKQTVKDDDALSAKLIEESGKIIKVALSKDPDNFDIIYNYACFLSRSGKINEALTELEKVFSKAPPGNVREFLKNQAANDPDFFVLKDEPLFKKLITS